MFEILCRKVTKNTNNPILSPTPTTNKPIFNADGSSSITLAQGEKWEVRIGFAPQHVGDNQEVEFFLYKDGATTAEKTLHLWVNVKGGRKESQNSKGKGQN
jgi:hypothetical protein